MLRNEASLKGERKCEDPSYPIQDDTTTEGGFIVQLIIQHPVIPIQFCKLRKLYKLQIFLIFVLPKDKIVRIWKKLSWEEIKEIVFSALKHNVNYYEEHILGVPASHLDDRVFATDSPFLKEAPFLSTLIHNPNHIGCHTLGDSESFFEGTQQLEKELIQLCAEDILQGDVNRQDGYVASGGTEANMQAMWIYRNYFCYEYDAIPEEICVLTSEDAHYSINKAANILGLTLRQIPVDPLGRNLNSLYVETIVDQAFDDGYRYFIVFVNMMTTMFGSVDGIEDYNDVLQEREVFYKIHVDGAYGGFYYPFANSNSSLGFHNPAISSITLDAHKMVQAPYGTGIFLIRKGYMKYALTKEASYVKGEDYTIIGSRSGANAVSVWMILMTYGPYGWQEKILVLQNRTDRTSKMLKEKEIDFFRNKYSNILAIDSKHIKPGIAEKYGLVPDNHLNPKWYKIVVMEHVTMEKLVSFVDDI